MLITIGGVSRAGKTTLARLLQHLLGHHRCQVISQDDHPQPSHLIPKIRDVVDWEVPASINWDAYHRDVLTMLDQGKIVIAEGLFIHRDIRIPKAALHIQIEIEKEVFVKRRKQEDRWGPEEPWYIEHVWSNHLRYGLADPDALRISGSEPFPLGLLIHGILKV